MPGAGTRGQSALRGCSTPASLGRRYATRPAGLGHPPPPLVPLGLGLQQRPPGSGCPSDSASPEAHRKAASGAGTEKAPPAAPLPPPLLPSRPASLRSPSSLTPRVPPGGGCGRRRARCPPALPGAGARAGSAVPPRAAAPPPAPPAAASPASPATPTWGAAPWACTAPWRPRPPPTAALRGERSAVRERRGRAGPGCRGAPAAGTLLGQHLPERCLPLRHGGCRTAARRRGVLAPPVRACAVLRREARLPRRKLQFPARAARRLAAHARPSGRLRHPGACWEL